MGDRGRQSQSGVSTRGVARPEEIKHKEDWALVQDCISGDRARWAALFLRYETTIEIAVRQTLQTHGAHAPAHRVEDIQGDIAVALVKHDFRKLRSYSGRCRLGAWLKVVASHHTIDTLRKQRPGLSLNADTEASEALRNTLTDGSLAPDEALAWRHRAEMLRSLYDELHDEDRRFVALFFEQDLGFDEIAGIMETSVGAVYARKNRVRKKLMRLARGRFGVGGEPGS